MLISALHLRHAIQSSILGLKAVQFQTFLSLRLALRISSELTQLVSPASYKPSCPTDQVRREWADFFILNCLKMSFLLKPCHVWIRHSEDKHAHGLLHTHTHTHTNLIHPVCFHGCTHFMGAPTCSSEGQKAVSSVDVGDAYLPISLESGMRDFKDDLLR